MANCSVSNEKESKASEDFGTKLQGPSIESIFHRKDQWHQSKFGGKDQFDATNLDQEEIPTGKILSIFYEMKNLKTIY